MYVYCTYMQTHNNNWDERSEHLPSDVYESFVCLCVMDRHNHVILRMRCMLMRYAAYMRIYAYTYAVRVSVRAVYAALKKCKYCLFIACLRVKPTITNFCARPKHGLHAPSYTMHIQ